jgi:hypothetical protein
MNTSELNQTITIARVKTRPGLIASAKTFCIICDETGLHVIHLGRAMGTRVKSNDPIANKLAEVMTNKMEAKMESALRDAERELEGCTLNQMLTRKHSFSVPFTETGSVRYEAGSGSDTVLVIKSKAAKTKLIGTLAERDAFESIARRFQP